MRFAHVTRVICKRNRRRTGPVMTTIKTVTTKWKSLRRLRRWSAFLGAMILTPCLTGVTQTDIRRDATVAATEKVLPTVVNIATTRIVEYRDPYQDWFLRFYGRRAPVERREDPEAIGSGVLINEEGYILTNFHVLSRASRVYVKLSDGRTIEADPLVATKQKDVALLKLRAPAGEKFPAIQFAADDDLLLGETVLALGNPYGLGLSVARGILSSKARRLIEANERLSNQDWLQTDASINPGNSGGPLINLRGELIGINVAVYREDQGMGVGFAIPVKQITAALLDFFAPEIKDAQWFGARLDGLRAPLRFAEVQPGSPAEQAGLQAAQKILQVNGQSPRDLVDFNRLLTANADHTARLLVLDRSGTRTVTVRLMPFEDLLQQKLGVKLRNLTPQDAASFKVNPGEGVFVQEVERNSPADKAQLPRGVLLAAINDQLTDSPNRAAMLLTSKRAGEHVRLSVLERRVSHNYFELRPRAVDVKVR